MSLLKEIQDAAVSSSADIVTVLRKCRVLAARLNNAELKSWVQYELDGYPAEVPLPDYRVAETNSKGHFFGAYGKELRNAPIPTGILGERVGAILKRAEFRDSISSLADSVQSGAPLFKQDWPADALHHFHEKIYEGMGLAQAWQEIPRSVFIRIVETVRNRILNFALEIEAANPDAGDAQLGSTPLSEKTVSQIFNNYITGNVGNIASGGSRFQQTATVQIAGGNANQLRETLKALGLTDDEASELKKAIERDPPLQPDKPFGKSVGAWMGKALGKAAQGALKVSTEVAVETLSRTIRGYCGLPPSP